MSNNLNYCMFDVKSSNMCASSDTIITKYSEDVKACESPSVSNNKLDVVSWNCNDRGSCNMGDGSYQKWKTDLRRN